MKTIRQTIKTLSIILILSCVPSLSGCAWAIAEIDTAAAIRETASVNLMNWKNVVTAKKTDHLAAVAELDAILIERLRASTGGAAAVVITESYRKTRARLTASNAAESAAYLRGLDNAMVMDELATSLAALRAKWDAFFNRQPTVRMLRAYADTNARSFVESIGKVQPTNLEDLAP